MYKMNHDFFDGFPVQFSGKETIVSEKEYSLGTFATEALEIKQELLNEIDQRLATFQKEFPIFLSSRDSTSAALTHTALVALWKSIGKLPLYEKLAPTDMKIHSLIRYMKLHPEEVDEMLTVGTERHAMMVAWQQKLTMLTTELRNFQDNTIRMIRDYFEDLPARSPAEYTKAYARFKRDLRETYDLAQQEDEDTSELDSIQTQFPFALSFQPRIHPKTGTSFLAEEIQFGTLESFLHIDLMRGMVAGNIPRLCHNCGHYFLAVGGYDTVYCTRIAPNETKKTCRKVGAHKKERTKNATEFIHKEYARAYNRLKGRKQRGSISVDKWNTQVAKAQELKALALVGEIGDGDYVKALDGL